MSEPQQADVEVKEGDILAGKYRVERVLGAGGMGVVVRAEHIVLKNRVALKFLLPNVAKHQQTAARFLREAQSAVRITSPHVARVIDVGQMEETGSPYMVMEYLEGKDLGEVLDQEGALAVDRACQLALQACEALAAAHAAGIVHRDIKPANLFITHSGDGSALLKVLDFGISKNTTDMGISSLTQTQVSMGSPLYMSPEQMRSARDVDARTDIWSMGVVLFEMLTAQLPFMAETMPQLCALVLEEVPPRVDGFRSDVPAPLAEAVARCLQKNRDERFANVGQLAEVLAPYAPGWGSMSAERTSRIISTAGLASTVESETSVAAAGRVEPPTAMQGTATTFGRTGERGSSVDKKRRLPGLVAVTAVGLVGVGALVALALGSGGDDAPGVSALPFDSALPLDPGAALTEVPDHKAAPSNGPSDGESADVEATKAEQTVAAAAPTSSAQATATVAEQPPEQKRATPRARPAQAKPRPPAVHKPKAPDPFGDRF